MKSKREQANALLSLYLKLYKETHGRALTINRYTEGWAAQDMIESVGYDRARELVQYYFTVKTNHQLQFLWRNFDRLDVTMQEKVKDEAYRQALREQTRKRMEEYEQRSQGN
jgi:hypothetical protein